MSASNNKYFFLSKKSTFIATFQKIFLHLQCIPFNIGDDGSPNIFVAGIFYAQALPIYIIRFRPPCGALMRPLPMLGGMQRESGTFSCTLSRIFNFIVSF